MVLKFLDAVDDDARSGGLRELEHYLGRFAGHDELIRREYERLTRGSTHLAPGPQTLIGGRYEVIESLGRGGFGEVFLAQDRQLDRRVAIKMLAALRSCSDEWRHRLVREAEAQNRIGDPGVCPVHDVGSHQGAPFLVMPWIQGRPLDRLIAISAALGEGPVLVGEPATQGALRQRRDAFLLLVERVARTLHRAHCRGVVHRDVKPANVLVREDGRPVLIDFGLAALQSGDEATTRSDTLGTPAYAAPEVLQGDGAAADARLDVWSLGVLLFEGLTLNRPFTAHDQASMARTVLTAPPPQLPRAFGRDLQAIVEHALARRAEQRYSTALAFAEDLARVRAGDPVSVRPAGHLRRAWMLARSRPRAVLVALSSSLVLGTATVLAGSAYVNGRERQLVEEAMTMLVSSLDDVVRDTQQLARFGVVIGERSQRVESLLTTVRRLRAGVGADAQLDRSLARVLVAAAGLQLQLGAIAPATARLEEALALIGAPTAADDDDGSTRALLAHVLILLGDARSHLQDGAGAEARYAEALVLHQQLLANSPDDATRNSDVGYGQLRLSSLRQRAGEHVRAEAMQRDAVRLLQRAVDLAPGEIERRGHVAEALLHLVGTLHLAGQPERACTELLDQAEQALAAVHAARPHDTQVLQLEAAAVAQRATFTTDEDQRLQLAQRRLELAEHLCRIDPNAPYLASERVRALSTLATALAEVQRTTEALAVVERAIAAADDFVQPTTEQLLFRADHFGAVATGAEIAHAAGEHERGEALARRVLQLAPDLWRLTSDERTRIGVAHSLLSPVIARAGGAACLLPLLEEHALLGPLGPELAALRQQASQR